MKDREFIKTEMDRALPGAQSDDLWRTATEKLRSVLEKYKELPAGVQSHTDSIFPSACIYLVVKDRVDGDIAYKIIEDSAKARCAAIQPKLAKIMKFPGMTGLFVKAWDPMTKNKFGPKCGFKNRFYPKKKGEYRMDVTSCPYFRYFTELGCPELTKIYCDNDVRVYGNLPGLKFMREGTIGRGADHCDFYVRVIKQDPR